MQKEKILAYQTHVLLPERDATAGDSTMEDKTPAACTIADLACHPFLTAKRPPHG
jgi:hypothetical protein